MASPSVKICSETLARRAPTTTDPNHPPSPQILNPLSRDLLAGRIPSDAALVADPELKAHVQRFAADEEAFRSEYAAAHLALSVLGSGLKPVAGGVVGGRGALRTAQHASHAPGEASSASETLASDYFSPQVREMAKSVFHGFFVITL